MELHVALHVTFIWPPSPTRLLISVFVGNIVTVMQFAVRRGSTRRVLIIGPLAFKFAIGPMGARHNRYEADLYRRTTPRRKAMLCPVIACSGSGAVSVMKAATPLTQSEFDELRASGSLPEWSDWDYLGCGDDGWPFETHKPDDWGWLNGKLVAVDYANVP